ncbi:WD domain, G-beta repeat domain containing protein [Babesia divergens]|uniref:WD domain, G-beta repeat domain containing protein n=1 Tax=Babesia divergens TaxID=32595 RepID=A0AAD9LJG8_BABDI|nr:WD domain, G-beta repeat domain containing protein [Babesia divergens]
MLIKCKTKSARVKGITFHPRLPFVIASMHCGEIQLWNYLNSTLVDVFTYHEGPVRGIDFHQLQPLFVSGGDDTNVVVWDFKQKKMLFALTGHTDYIRTVQFHPDYPWIVSAADDHTVRIWNWQGRNCISVLKGHTHYVMCASFHPTKDLLVSASLDHTARIWDVTTLREKHCAIQGIGNQSSSKLLSNFQLINSSQGHSRPSDFGKQGDRLPFADITCIYTLTGHNKGVNWAIFHDTLPLVITAGDDKTIRVWRFSGPNAWQTNILRGHNNNVCSLIMHPNNFNYLLSVSEDRSIKVWDTKKWSLSHTFMLENDRFWVVQKARKCNYIAAGHDSGFIVFKLFKERPIVTLVGNTLYYVWNDNIYASDIEREVEAVEEETPRTVRTCSHMSGSSAHGISPRMGETPLDVLELEGFMNFGGNMHQNSLEDEQSTQIRDDLVFPSPANDFCKTNRTQIATLSGVDDCETVVQKFMTALLINAPITAGVGSTGGLVSPFSMYYNQYCSDKNLFLVNYTFKGRSFYEVILRNSASVGAHPTRTTCYLAEGISVCFASRTSIAAVSPSNKVIVHSFTGDLLDDIEIDIKVDKVFPICVNVILLWGMTENKIVLFDVASRRQLTETTSCYEKLCNIIVSKSKKVIAAIFKTCVVIYDRNLKKLASKQMQGKIKTAMWYDNTALFFATSDRMHYIMVNGDSGVLRSLDEPIYMIRIRDNFLYYMQRNHRCYRMSIISDEFSFKMALYQNNMATATRLIESGKIRGNTMVAYLVEKGYPLLARMIITDIRMRFDIALSFGNITEALEDAQALDKSDAWKNLGDAALDQGNCEIAEIAFQKAKMFNKLSLLYMITGNTAKLRKMLNICKFRNDIPGTIQHSLYLGDMNELSNILKENGQSKLAEICQMTYGIGEESAAEGSRSDAVYMVPPHPINRLSGVELNWSVRPVESEVKEPVYYDDADPAEAELDVMTMDEFNPTKTVVNADIWGTIDEISPSETMESLSEENLSSGTTSRGRVSAQNSIFESCQSPLDYIAIGQSHRALEMLEKSFGLSNRKALDDIVEILNQTASQSAQNSHTFDSMSIGTNESQSFIDHEYVAGIMNQGYGHVTAGAFDEATTEFRLALRHLIFLVSDQSRAYIDQCRVYVTAMLLEAERERLAESDIRRSLELAVYFSCCDLLPQHRYLVLRRTMGIMWKAQNYVTAAKLVRRLMAQDVSNIDGAEEEMQKAKRIYALCEQKGIEMHSLDYDESDEKNLRICTVSLVKIHGNPIVQCRFCHAVALEQFQSQTCNICQLCRLSR